MRIAEEQPLKTFETGRRQYPKSGNDADLDAFVAEFAMPLFHPSSSCAMGKVVDSELRVLGLSGLRVADASIMPSIVRGNPNAAIIMIGEKAADMTRGDR
jgi:choline dehydrogenase-like flavoprotein